MKTYHFICVVVMLLSLRHAIESEGLGGFIAGIVVFGLSYTAMFFMEAYFGERDGSDAR